MQLLKLDMSKAYDRVEWKYVEALLGRLGFSSKWTELIMRCIKTVKYRVRVNGNLTKPFSPTRGIRQGDPLSPYIFVICAQGLSSLLKGCNSMGLIKGLKMASRGPTITHLFFADDSLIFFKADPNSCVHVKESLESYEAASGQVINLDKSALSFSPNTAGGNQQRVKEILRIRVSRSHELYLGVPSFSMRSKRLQFGYLKDRLLKRIETWNHKRFTKGGKEVLIKSVLQAIPTFAMSCFRIPTSICKEMESACARFWWKNSGSNTGVHWRTWDWLSRSKEEGGLGFRRLGCFNRALLAKQSWRMINKPNSLVCQVFKSRYFRSVDIMEAGLGNNPSFVWRSLIWGRELLKEGIKWRTGNGKLVRASCRNWFSDWAISAPSSCRSPDRAVAYYIDHFGRWKEAEIRNDFVLHEAEEILRTPIEKDMEEDIRYWSFQPKGVYTVSSGYEKCAEMEMLRGRVNFPTCSETKDRWWRNLWMLEIPPKIKLFWWQLSWDILATESNLQKRHILPSAKCRLCEAQGADAIHAIFLCPFVRKIWSASGLLIPSNAVRDARTIDFLGNIINANEGIEMEKIISWVWATWKKRCELVHSNQNSTKRKNPLSWNKIEWAAGMIEEYKRACNLYNEMQEKERTKQAGAEIRKLGQCFVCISDASFDVGRGKTIAGRVLTDGKGRLIEWEAGPERDANSSLEAELFAILEGVRMIINRKGKRACVISDCLDVVKAINDEEEVWNRGGYALDHIRNELRNFEDWRVIYLGRKFTEAAHFIASRVRRPSDSRVDQS